MTIRQQGWTIVELLVALAVVSVLIALLLPAVQAARETARKSACSNNLKQLSLGVQSHLTANRKLPSAGWGVYWIGLRDRGMQTSQPGSWIFNTLPYIEADALRQRAPTANDIAGSISSDVESYCQETLPILSCPAKRPRRLERVYNHAYWNAQLKGMQSSDYAMNAGSQATGKDFAGPKNIMEGDQANLPWPDRDTFDGVCGIHVQFGDSDVSDGLSHTLLIGEKFVRRRSELDAGDDQCPWTGFGIDNVRYSTFHFFTDDDRHGDPQSFGTSHRASVPFAMCDGSCTTLSLEIDSDVLKSLAIRHDGRSAP